MHAHFSTEHVEEFKTTASERNAYKIFSTRNHSYMVIVFCLLMGAMLDGVEMLATTACLRVNTVNAVFILHRCFSYFVRRNAAGYILVYIKTYIKKQQVCAYVGCTYGFGCFSKIIGLYGCASYTCVVI